MTEPVRRLEGFPLLRGLTGPEMRQLSTILEDRTLEPGEGVFQEDDVSNELYLIARGSISIQKTDPRAQGRHIIATLPRGEVVGEMAFLDGSRRSAAATAAEETDLIVLDKDRLLGLPGGPQLFSKLASNIALDSRAKLRLSSASHATSLEAQLQLIRAQNDFGQFFIYILACYAIGTIINSLLQSYLSEVDVYTRLFSWTYLLVLLVPSLVTIRVMKVPLSKIGVTFHNWRQAVIEGLLASGACVALFFAIAALTPLNPPSLSSTLFVWGPSYFLHSCVQEFLARGVVQTSFQRFFADKTGIKSVFLASILFSLFHVHFGLAAIVITLISSILFGLLYLRHGNLIGVCLVHGVAGTGAFMLGLI